MSHLAYIAVGSNLGDRAGMINRALDLLDESAGIRVTARSDLLETPSEGGPADAPPYLNGAAAIETTLAPRQLLDRLMAIEHTLGRRRPEVPNAPRTIDLDLLLYDDLVIDEPHLSVPHPRLHRRRFVLQPLAQIAPALCHPRFDCSIDQLLHRLPPPPSPTPSPPSRS